MTDPSNPATPPKSASEKLAELVAKKASAAAGYGPGAQGRKQTERAAAARAASKSRPAQRKG